MRARAIAAAVMSCAVALTGAGLSGCGNDGSGGEMVARVGRTAITKATLTHWTRIEAILSYEVYPKAPPPAGVIPDPPGYGRCIAHFAAHHEGASGGAKPTTRQLRGRCASRQRLLEDHVLEILISYYWEREAAAKVGVAASLTEVSQTQHRPFSSQAAFRRYLSLAGESASDSRLIAERDVLSKLLLARDERIAKAAARGGAKRREQAVIKAADAYTRESTARTSCKAGYVSALCRQYRGAFETVVP